MLGIIRCHTLKCKHLIIGAILVGCIVAEDFYNILIVPISLAPS